MKRKHTRRRRQQGATLVETLIVVPVFAIFLGGGYRIYQLSDARLKALHDAREAAWLATIDGCNDSGPYANFDWLEIMKRFALVATGMSPVGMAMRGEQIPEDAIALAIEGLGGEDTQTRVGLQGSGDEKVGVLEERVLMGCNETPHDLGTRRNSLEWAVELWLDQGG